MGVAVVGRAAAQFDGHAGQSSWHRSKHDLARDVADSRVDHQRRAAGDRRHRVPSLSCVRAYRLRHKPPPLDVGYFPTYWLSCVGPRRGLAPLSIHQREREQNMNQSRTGRIALGVFRRSRRDNRLRDACRPADRRQSSRLGRRRELRCSRSVLYASLLPVAVAVLIAIDVALRIARRCGEHVAAVRCGRRTARADDLKAVSFLRRAHRRMRSRRKSPAS